MAYTIESTEKLRKPGSETETKALLYLMNSHQDCNEIYYFVVDVFNDLTGMDRAADYLWDVQSKANRAAVPGDIGKGLVTLFKNYTSEFVFNAYILFVGGVSKGLRIDGSSGVFGIENIRESNIKRIKEGLKKEGKKKTYIDDSLLTDEKINEFLSQILIVVDDGRAPSEYVKDIIRKYPKIIPEDADVLTAIFNEIRYKQASKKEINVVEGNSIVTADQVLEYCRHLTSSEIRLMVLQRLINANPLNGHIPVAFNEIYNQWPPEARRERLEDCQRTLCRALFNKNAKDEFWCVFENIYTIVTSCQNISVQQAFLKLKEISDCVSRHPDFDVTSIKYLISLVIDGIQP